MRSRFLTTLFLTAFAISWASASEAGTSIWATRPGKILSTDQTVWCQYSESVGSNGAESITASLMEINTDGTIVTSNYSDSTTTLAVGVQCWNGTTGMGAPIHSAFGSKTATVSCPVGDFGYFLRCQIKSTDNAPIIYDGSDAGGSPCGAGVSGITVPSSNGFKGQITGQTAVLNYGPPNNTLFNTNTMTTAEVYGTDLGYMFYASGKLWAGYGDTWANQMQVPVSPTLKRGSVLFNTTNFDPTGGLVFQSFVGASGPGYATEVVPSCHNTCTTEATAIASAGFGLQEGGHSYHVLWFTSFKSWFPSIALNDASVAWSKDGGAFTRGDQSSPAGPVWGSGGTASNFGAGAIWQDRLNGWVYLFGTQPYQAQTGVRLARVPAKFASVTNPAAYQYWNGSTWASSESSAVDIVPASESVGPELSVAFDGYANRFLMMIDANRESTTSDALQLWTATAPTGPWTQVSTGSSLPNSGMTGGRYAGNFWFFYGPYMSQEIMTGGGQSVYYQLSEWNGTPACPLYPLICSPYPAGLPYNVGLWTYNVNRSLVSLCTP